MEANVKMTKAEILEITKEKEASQTQKIKEQAKEIKEQAKLQSDLTEQMEAMQKMLIGMQANQNAPATTKNEETTYTVMSNLSGKNSISLDRESTIDFDGHGSSEELTIGEVKAMIKFSRNKKLFVNGILYFEEEEAYDKFKVKVKRILNDEFLLGLFDMEKAEFLSELKTATQNKQVGAAVHTIIFRLAYLYKDGQIKNVSKDLMDAFKDFFGVSLFDVQLT
jgi:hypothetical protein